MRYLFEDYALDTDRRELRRGAALIAITPQAFDLLHYLIRNRMRVVSKDDLISAIWNGRIVSDAALTTRLNAARHAVGDNGSEQRLIKTLPRKGMRFVGVVREETRPPGRPAATLSTSPAPASGHESRPSIVVLPFATVPEGPDYGLIASGIAEDILAELSKLRWLIVHARDPGCADRNGATDVWQIGEEPGTRYVLDGRVRQVERRVRITARLIDARTGTYVWVGRYDRNLVDVFAAHDEITEMMVSAIAPAILHAERQRAIQKLPENLGAWDAYQRGMWHMSKCEAAENRLAQVFFQQAIDLDPTFAPSHGALAWSHMMAASIFSQMSIADGCALADPLVRNAIALDEYDLEARARLALSALLQGDLEGSFDDSRQILARNDKCADALGVQGAALVYSGRRKEGRAALRQFLSLSPRDPARPIRMSQVATSFYLDENYEAASFTARQIIRQYPKHPIAYRWLAASLGQLGKTAEAELVLQNLLAISPSSFEMYVRQRPRYCSIEYAPMLAGLRKAGWKE